MCYGENGTVKFLETLADNVFRHNYSMMQINKKRRTMGLPRSTPLLSDDKRQLFDPHITCLLCFVYILFAECKKVLF